MISTARTMRAVRAVGPDPASLTCQRLPVPWPGPGELLVEVRATAVTAGELTWPQTWPTCQQPSAHNSTAPAPPAKYRPRRRPAHRDEEPLGHVS